MSILSKRIAQLQEELAVMEEPSDRFEYFVERAQSAPTLAAEFCIDSFKVPGCISQLWIVPSVNDDHCFFLCDGDAVIPKGIALVLLDLFQGVSANEIVAFDKSKLNDLGIAEILTPNRRNALSSVFSAVYNFASSLSHGSTSEQQAGNA
jgi:cysteine desulfuration protein SufE